ncbi:hypothetical protein [Antrihabitans stalactiti]|nr:hypothetical protein [Antrihabitans stalactiti]
MRHYSTEECESLKQALIKMGFHEREAAAIASTFVDRESHRTNPNTAA